MRLSAANVPPVAEHDRTIEVREGLAQKLAAGECPIQLQHKRLS